MPEPTLIDSELNPQPVAPPVPMAGENNRYAAPRARVADVYNSDGATQPVKLFSAKGRIGRWRYWCWMSVLGLSFYVLGNALAFAFGALLGFSGLRSPEIIWVVGMACMIPFYVMTFLLVIQRSHDMNWSGWTSLCALIPFVGFIWGFKSGTPGPNRFGPPPPPTPLGVKIFAFIIPIGTLVVGILVALALPAYKNYLERARSSHATGQVQRHDAPRFPQQENGSSNP
ncbi:MAG: DUF805 domain-containing protein [Burkholderiaceae bacterium]|nr:DUF805 domain-containing protein [Burkholderiaceae bacterium]